MATKNVARLKVAKASARKIARRSRSPKDGKSTTAPYAEGPSHLDDWFRWEFWQSMNALTTLMWKLKH